LSLVEQTCLTTRNIAGGMMNWMHWFSGGISLQIEHHMFPIMPRANLIKAQPYVKEFVTSHGLVFEESSLWECLKHNMERLDVNQTLHDVMWDKIRFEGDDVWDVWDCGVMWCERDVIRGVHAQWSWEGHVHDPDDERNQRNFCWSYVRTIGMSSVFILIWCNRMVWLCRW